MKKIAVVGAGITGITTAYYLAKNGFDVTVYDKERYAGMVTSYANGGQISVSNSEVWNTWSNIKKGIKWTFKKDAPLWIRPSPTYSKVKWILGFLKTTISNKYEENTELTIKLGLHSRELYEDIISNENIEFDRLKSGILHFYKDKNYFNDAIKAGEIYRRNKVEWEILSPENTTNIDKALSEVKGVIGGAWTHSDWTGDIHKFCYNLSTILKEKYNVSFKYNHDITNLNEITKEYDAIIVTSGVGSVKLAKSIGDNLPIYPVKGYSITINNVEESKLPKVSLMDDQAKIVTATLGNKLRVAGTAELNGENYDILRDRIEPLLNWVHTNLPEINTNDYTSWACLRPMTPDMLPIVKQSENNKKVFYNTGHGHLGWTLGPATAYQVVELLKKKQNSLT